MLRGSYVAWQLAAFSQCVCTGFGEMNALNFCFLQSNTLLSQQPINAKLASIKTHVVSHEAKEEAANSAPMNSFHICTQVLTEQMP